MGNVKEKKRMAENVYCLAQALMQKDQVINDIGRKLQAKNECAEALRRSLSRSLVERLPRAAY